MGEGNGRVPATDARAEYDAATRDLGFTKDFNPSLETIMMDPAAGYGQRFLAWLKRRSWGNYRLYAVTDEGKPATQTDCCNELGIDKRAISDVVVFYERRGYLYREGKLLYPSIAPKLSPLPEKVRSGPDFLEFLEHWKVAQASDFLELEVAQATSKRLGLVRLSAYKQWRKARTNGAVSLIESKESSEREEEATAAFVSLPEESEPLPETPSPPFPDFPTEHQNGNTKEPKPEPEPEPEPEPVSVEAFAEAVQARFPKNPPTVAQCSEVLAKLRRLKLSTDGFIEHLNPERMEKISHGGALTALMEGYKVTVAAERVREEERLQRKDVGCPSCGGFSTTDGRCSFCGKPRRGG